MVLSKSVLSDNLGISRYKKMRDVATFCVLETMKSLLQKRLIIGNDVLRKTSRMFALLKKHGNLRIKVRILVAI